MFDTILPLAAITDWFSAQYLLDLFLQNAGYALVFIFMMIESTFLPFPSEVVVPPAAFLAAQSTRQIVYNDSVLNIPDMTVWGVFLVATAGALVGSLINYGLALWLGRPIIYSFANSRLGHACLLDEQKVDKAEKYFDEHGGISTFIGRLIPVIRQLISIPAGLARMNIWKFMLFTTLGAGLWNVVLCVLGYWLGKNISVNALYQSVEQYNHYFTIGGFILLLACIAYIIWQALKKRPSKS